MTRTVVARGSEWSRTELLDGWGADTSAELAADLADQVVAEFHSVVDSMGCTFHWTPGTSEVTAEVFGNNSDEHSMWDFSNAADEGVDLDELRENAHASVWERFCAQCD